MRRVVLVRSFDVVVFSFVVLRVAGLSVRVVKYIIDFTSNKKLKVHCLFFISNDNIYRGRRTEIKSLSHFCKARHQILDEHKVGSFDVGRKNQVDFVAQSQQNPVSCTILSMVGIGVLMK